MPVVFCPWSFFFVCFMHRSRLREAWSTLFLHFSQHGSSVEQHFMCWKLYYPPYPTDWVAPPCLPPTNCWQIRAAVVDCTAYPSESHCTAKRPPHIKVYPHGEGLEGSTRAHPSAFSASQVTAQFKYPVGYWLRRFWDFCAVPEEMYITHGWYVC